MTTEQLLLPVIVLGRKLELLVTLDLHGISISNPRDPSVSLFDGMSGVTELERSGLKTHDPQVFQVLGKTLGRQLLFSVAQHYVQAVKESGALKPHRAPVWVEDVRAPVVPAGQLEDDVASFFKVSAAHLGRAAYSVESLAVSTGHPVPELESYLQAQVEAGVLCRDGDGYALRGAVQPEPWQLPEGVQGQQPLGLNARLIRVMIGGPGDTHEEVKKARAVLDGWNLRNAEELGAVLLFKHWQLHSYPAWNERPQALINEQLVDRADLLVAVFWTRLGMDSGTDDSGTVEEIRRMAAAGRPVKVYFSSRSLPVQAMGDDRAVAEFRRVHAFRQETEQQFRGMYGTFDSTDTFGELLDRHLTNFIRDLRDRDFLVQQSPQGSLRAFRERRTSELATLRRTVTKLEIEFGSSGHRGSAVAQQQRTLGRLAEALTAHYADWKPHLIGDAREALDGLIRFARQLASEPGTYDSAAALDDNGQELLNQVKRWLDVLEGGLRPR
ncbi:hypothetical protein ACFQDE_19415 [Deinococcus caeni]|uniref:DUF4062 domain-containing protein n=1 Tax=Deinococcus caeni TaxID=569127 RepID=A0ABP9UGW7_9DEIO